MSAHRAEHVLIWEFQVRAGREAEFEAIFGPAGAWVKLFATAEGYLGTELLRDPELRHRYLTIDRWASPEAFARFREARAEEYEALDARCAPLTEAETPLGPWIVIRG